MSGWEKYYKQEKEAKLSSYQVNSNNNNQLLTKSDLESEKIIIIEHNNYRISCACGRKFYSQDKRSVQNIAGNWSLGFPFRFGNITTKSNFRHKKESFQSNVRAVFPKEAISCLIFSEQHNEDQLQSDCINQLVIYHYHYWHTSMELESFQYLSSFYREKQQHSLKI